MRKVERKSIFIWNMISIRTSVIYLFLSGVVFYFFGQYEWVARLVVIAVGWTLIELIKELVRHQLAYKNTEYLLTDAALLIKDGGFIVSENTIPLIRIQHADIEQNFYSRFFGLYTLNIYTAGDNHRIEYIKRDVADELRTKIIKTISKDTNDDEQ